MFNLAQQLREPRATTRQRTRNRLPAGPSLARSDAHPPTAIASFLRHRKKIKRYRYLTRGIVMLKEAVDQLAIRFNYPPIIPTESHYREIKVCNLFFGSRPRAGLEERLGGWNRRFS
jgi:hypothetical protein